MIFEFSNVQTYLKHYIKQLPKRGFGEAKKIADQLQVSSTYISQILAGAKILSIEQTIALGKYLGLSPLESDYLFYLVQAERAGTQDLKKFCLQKLKEIKESSLSLVNRVDAKKVLTEQEKSIFYSSAVYSAIHIYCATHKKGRTLEEIAQRFEISRAKANKMMRFLVETQLCIENNEHFFTGTQSTHLEQSSPYLLKHHANWRLRAITAAENLNEKEMMYTLNVALSQKDFDILREEMVIFVTDFLKKVYPSPSEEIACFNMDWFWIRN